MAKVSLEEIMVHPTYSYEHLFQSNRPFKAILPPLDLEKKGATKKIKRVLKRASCQSQKTASTD
jgi:hypothetical protein